MFHAMKLRFQVSNASVPLNLKHKHRLYARLPSDVRLPKNSKIFLPLSSASLNFNDPPSLLTSSVTSPPPSSLPQSNITYRHILLLYAVASAVSISMSWLFFSAIPALVGFRRAAESLEKLMDVMRQELPDTMAAVRLSGMEISDLTMELSDLGQEITKGVKSSTQAVRVAEDRLRRLTTMPPKALVQEEQTYPKIETPEPGLAKAARGMRQGIVHGRSLMQIFFTITRFSKLAINYFAHRGKQQS